MKWNNKSEVKIGDMGESLVKDYFEKQGWVIYKPETEKAHPFDRLAVKGKDRLMIIEVKTKPHRLKYPDTGFDINHYDIYKNTSLKHNMEVFVAFVDPNKSKIYGNYLSILEEKTIINNTTYPLKYKGIIYFPLEKMILLSDIPDYISEMLMEMSDRNYNY